MARHKQPGAYILTHVQSGHLYIGSTNDLHSRKGTHESALRCGKHGNKRLQELYDVDQRIHFSGIPFLTKEEALDEEQRLIDSYKASQYLLNVYLDVRNPAASRSANGYRHSEETRDKMSAVRNGKILSDTTKEKMRLPRANSAIVVIDGIEYFSVSFAARTLGLPHSSVRWRLSSENFPTWLYKSTTEGNQNA